MRERPRPEERRAPRAATDGAVPRHYFQGGHGGRGKYGPLRTSTTARYGTNSRNQSYLGAGHSGRRVDGSAKKSKDWTRGVLRASNGVESSASSGGTITCPECGHTTFSKRDMHRHIATRHGGKVKRPRKPNPKTGANSSNHGDSIGGKAGSVREISNGQIFTKAKASLRPSNLRESTQSLTRTRSVNHLLGKQRRTDL